MILGSFFYDVEKDLFILLNSVDGEPPGMTEHSWNDLKDCVVYVCGDLKELFNIISEIKEKEPEKPEWHDYVKENF